ncbi:hypothetical protein ABZ869_03700 [Streptomyces sp. NPDC046928]|uniref:hypothetical protein n=1 Tax=Streptomyces sp. NPDC046928 TaxID=3155021 RepID=UPI0033F1C4F6
MSEQEHDLALQELAKAAEQYEEYVKIAQIGTFVANEERHPSRAYYTPAPLDFVVNG